MIFLKLAALATPLVSMQTLAVTFEQGIVPLIVAVIAGVAPLSAVVLTYRRQATKMSEIHVLVNSRLTEALDEIQALKGTLVRKDTVIADQAQAADLARIPPSSKG